MKNKFLSLTEKGRWLLATLTLIFTLGIGQMWAADPTHESPSIVKVANRHFLNLASTPANVTVSTDSYSNYGPGYFVSNKNADLSASWWSFTGTFKSSGSTYSNVSGAVGFHATGSSGEFYNKLQMRTGSDRMTQMDFYVTGTTQIGFQWKNANTSGSKYLEFAIYEMNVSGTTATDGTSPICTVQGSKTSDADQYAASTALSATKYYHVVVTPHNTSNLNFYGLTFKHAPAASYTITYDANGGSGTMSNSTNTVSACTFTAPDETKEFKEWRTNADGTGTKYEAGDAASSDLDLYAIWQNKVVKYDVTFNSNGGSAVAAQKVVEGQTATEPTAPTRDCYTFAGWYNGENAFNFSTAINANTELTAHWTPVYSSSATLISDAVVSGKPNVNTVFAASNIVSSITFTSGNYEFTSNETKPGYYGYKDKASGDYMKIMLKQGKRAQVLFGNLGADPTITVNGVAKSLDAARTTDDMAENTFTWTASAEDALISITMGSGTNTLKKVDIVQLYNATRVDEMNLVGGEDNNVTEVTLPTPSPTTKEGKNFTGWKANQIVTVDDVEVDANTLIAAEKTAVLGANTTFTAQWVTPSNFDVKFFQGYGDPDAQIGDKQTISTGNFAVAPADPTRTGFAFLGWSYDATAEHIVTVSEYPITAETNFTAMWKAVWTVTFDGAGNVNVNDGAKVSSPNSPSQAGKVFLGWYNGDNKYDFSANVTANMALTSKWEDANANHFYYNYKDDFHYDGVVYKSPEGKVDNKDGESNKAITTPYTLFSGAAGITSIVAIKAIYDSKSNWVNAYLKINTSEDSYLTFTIASGYTAVLKMKMGGYSSNPTVTLKKGEDVVDAASGTIGGVASTENNYNEITYNLVAGTYTMTTATKTLYISHIDLEATALPTYTVTYSAGEGSVKEGQSIPTQEAVEAGTVITLASGDALEKSGYVFNGWLCNIDSEVKNPSAEYTMTAAATTFTAQWLEDNGMAKLYRSDDTPDAGNPYTTLVAAVAAAQDGDKIVLQRNVLDGAGIMLTKDDHKTITIDFNTYTYTAVSPGVGSAGTQNQAFHLEKGNTVTLKNGTIACSGSEIKMLIQNYCDLTLENITLDGSGLEGSHRYVLSNNCGAVEIGDGTTITAKDGDVAFDVCATNYYPEGVTVTVKEGATISGIVEYDVWGTKPANNQATLAIEGGEFDITWNVESALAEDAKENLNVSAGSFSEAVPVEYCADGYIPAPQDPITNKYTVKEGWKVTFVDGEDVEIVPVDKNTPVAEKAMSDKIGYTFDGWFNGVDLYDFTANVTADLTLNAKWTAFAGCADLWPATSGDALIVGAMVDLQAGSVGGSIKVANLGAEGSIAYNANGLSFSNGGKDSVLVTLNNDLKNGSVIKVRLMANGGTKDNGRGLNLLNAARVKKALLGWQANEEVTSGDVREFTYTVVESDGFAGTNVFTLQRQNSVFLQSIKVEECGDAIVYHNVTSEVNIAGKGTVTLGASSVREGYTTTATYSGIDPLYEFVSWEVSGEGASIENATANPATITVGTEDAVVTLNLQLIPVKFTVNYYDGTTLKGTELVVVNENPTASEINTNKRHFTFQGWSDTDGGSVVALNTITRTEATTVNLYAVYAPVDCPTEGTVFSMEFDNTKTPTETVVAPKNGGVVELANYATISGGDARIINNNSSNKDAISTSGQFLLKATDEVMKIELECAIATGDVIRIPDNSAKAVLSTSDAKTGTYATLADKNTHEFEATAAWNGVDDLYVLYDGSSLNFTKVYVLRPYTISFDLQGHGDAIDAQKLVEGKKVAEPTEEPTADGWDFKGWYKEAACTNAWDFDNDVVEGTMSLFAKWTEHVTNDATLKSLKYGTTAITLVDGIYTYNVELAAVVPAVPALTAETNAALATTLISDATEFVAGQATSTVLVTAEDGATQLLYTVNFTKEAALPQVNVTEATVWNFATAVAGSTSMENLTDVVLANVPGITNDATFNSQALKGTFNKMPGNYFQGSKLNFITEVPGKLTITFRGTNNNARHLQVCVGDGEAVVADWNYQGSGESAQQEKTVFVPAGKVTLKAFEGETAQNARIYNMIFDATPDYTRNVTNNIGTLCVEHNVPAGQYLGATFYQIASRNELYNDKIDFEEVLPNEELKAGEPYIFQSTTGRIDLFFGETEATQPVAIRGMIGNFAASTLAIDENNQHTILYIAQNKLWSCENLVGQNLILNDHRAYIDMTQVPTYADYQASLQEQQNPAPRRRVTLGKDAEQVVTGVENLNASEQPVKLLINGQIFILRGEKMFDATGRLVK